MVNSPSALGTTLLRFCAVRMLALMEDPMRAWLLSGCLTLLLLAQQAAAQTLLVVGDSISAGLGLDTGQGWVSLLEKRLKEKGYDYRVVNASISGDTSAGGLARLPALLAEEKPELVVIELGGNDGLRGMAPMHLQQNLAAMVSASRDSGAKVILLGMRLPPNYGEHYTQAFAQVFQQVAEQQKVALVPFFLDRVGGNPQLMQPDGIHPAADAQPLLLENLWPTLKPLL
ncbi:Esterase TesA [compost metagenome]